MRDDVPVKVVGLIELKNAAFDAVTQGVGVVLVGGQKHVFLTKINPVVPAGVFGAGNVLRLTIAEGSHAAIGVFRLPALEAGQREIPVDAALEDIAQYKDADAFFDGEAAVGPDINANIIAVDVFTAEVLGLRAVGHAKPDQREDEGDEGENVVARAPEPVPEQAQTRTHEKSTSVTARWASSSISKKSAFTKPNMLAMITLGKDSTVVLKVRTAPL